MAESVPNLPTACPPDALWQQIVQDYRQLCVLQRQARGAECDRLLRDELPTRILAWAEQDGADGAAKARRLDDMFQAEQRRFADAWAIEQTVAQRLRSDLLPALSAQINEEVQRAIQRHVPSRPLPSAAGPVPVSVPCPAPSMVQRSEPAHARARASVGDIPSIIDLILEQERQSDARHLAA
jgi:hypothetical protein